MRITKIPINSELDVIVARMQARQMARQIGFGTVDQARISLATSELARLACANSMYSGEIVMSDAEQNGQQGMRVVCSVNAVDSNTAPSEEQPTWTVEDNNFRRGLASASRLVDESVVEMEENGQTKVTLLKWFS